MIVAPAAAPAAPKPVARDVMDIRQAAAYLGVSTDALYHYAANTSLPAFKLGNRWRFRKQSLDDWMERMTAAHMLAKKAHAKKRD